MRQKGFGIDEPMVEYFEVIERNIQLYLNEIYQNIFAILAYVTICQHLVSDNELRPAKCCKA